MKFDKEKFDEAMRAIEQGAGFVACADGKGSAYAPGFSSQNPETLRAVGKSRIRQGMEALRKDTIRN